jgi:DNA-binding MarR family transcriptional regulator
LHPAGRLDDLVHQRARLGILAIAAEPKRVEFRYLQSELDMTAGNLTTHLDALEKGGLVSIAKGYEGRRPRTWVSITRKGRGALKAEVAALKEIVKAIEEPAT